ncbi:LysR family transcriptional regulator [Blautia schinkii]|nr:LysR family transcriptional regulator [Blautia schinkii]
MTRRHLLIFVTVYQEMSITAASRKLHLAQPSVSLAVKELEEAYRIKLFDRINRRLYVTEKGREFYGYAKHIVDLFDEMESVMVSPDMPGTLHIGSSITIGNFLVPSVAAEFNRVYPNCEVKVRIENSRQVIQAVLKNELDLGLVEDKADVGLLEEIPFMEDRLYFVCGSGHPLAYRNKVTLKEIAAYPFCLREQGSASREITDSVFQAEQLKYRLLWESVSNQALIHAVEQNTGITVLSGRLISEELKAGRLVKLPLYPAAFLRSFTLIYHKKKYLTESLKLLIELFRQRCDLT